MNPDDDYKQIFFSNQYFCNEDRHLSIRINLTHRSYLLIFIFLVFTSQSITALPVSPIANYYHVQSLPINRLPSTPVIPSYSNGMIVKVVNDNQRQFKRERYRRSMIDRLFSQFDEDADGQLSKDELYSFSLRLNIFPHFHNFLKNQQGKSQ